VTPERIRAAARSALDEINPALAALPSQHPLAAIAGDLRRLVISPDQTLLTTDMALTQFLPDSLIVLVRHSMHNLSRWRQCHRISLAIGLPDGRARVQVLPQSASRTSVGLHEFVDQVTSVAQMRAARQ